MPSSATITSFFEFTPGTKARSAQVDTNFSTFRGHVIPVDPNTAASADDTYDLGANLGPRWRQVYCRSVDFLSSTTTGASVEAVGVTNLTAGALQIKINDTVTAQFGADGIHGGYLSETNQINTTVVFATGVLPSLTGVNFTADNSFTAR